MNFYNTPPEKIILTDCDGVLLSWKRGFDAWMDRKGYIRKAEFDRAIYSFHVEYGIPFGESRSLVKEFNESAAAGYLDPLDINDPVAIRILFNEGFKFGVITSFTDDVSANMSRIRNLGDVFGDYIFNANNYLGLSIGADKTEALAKYVGKATYWVEDKVENAIVGADFGFKTFLIASDHNETDDPRITRVGNWMELAHRII